LLRNLALEARYIHRRFGNFIGYIDRRLDEWTSFQASDPGPDGRPGTSDDGGTLIGFQPYNGDRDLVIGNPDGAFRQYDALQMMARKRHARGWEMQASYTWSRSVGTISGGERSNFTFRALSPLGYGGSPGNTVSFRDAGTTRNEFDYSEFKVLGFCRLPWLQGATFAGIYRWHTGTRWHRIVVTSQPAFAVLAAETPYSRQTSSLSLLDLRVEKTFLLPERRGTVGVYVDAINVANVGRALAYTPGSGPDSVSPSDGRIRVRIVLAFVTAFEPDRGLGKSSPPHNSQRSNTDPHNRHARGR
jgi:hypothetical protein